MLAVAKQWIRSLGRRLALKPYGNSLLTPGAEWWVFFARLIILVMAAAEAVSWGYMGTLFARVNSVVGGALAAAAIFALIWIVDASFMTLDTSRSFYERELVGRQSSRLKEKLKLGLGVTSRVIIVGVTLAITSPFLAQLLFSKEVTSEMAAMNNRLIAVQRERVLADLVDREKNLLGRLDELGSTRIAEAAGTGPSSRYGDGPALKAIEREIADRTAELGDVRRTLATEAAEYDALSRDDLAEKYGLKFVEPGIQASGAVLEELLENPSYTNAQVAIKSFLVL